MGPLEQPNPPPKDANPIKEEVKDGLAIKDPLKAPVFVPIVPNVPPKVNECVKNPKPSPKRPVDEEDKKEEAKDTLAIKDPLKVPVFVPTVPRKNFEFVIPNKAIFKDNFWT